MLDVERVTMAAARAGLGLVAGRVAKHGDLVGQFQRAVLSQALNTTEGLGRTGKDRAHFFAIARGSSKEASVALALLEALGAVPPGAAAVVERELDRGRAMLWRMAH
ncbi:MAG: four helix bundle protein [Deltaproteobacteria bacterium]|nr:four helix bundle protein [Deltaproteobacteria bacterium]